MADSKSNMKAIRLDETIGSVTPAKLEATRQHVQSEIEAQALRSADIPTLSSATESPSLRQVEWPPLTPTPVLASLPPEPEDERIRKLDIITDVQLVLVEKYRRAATLMWVAITLLVLSLASLTVGVFVGLAMQRQLASIASEQQGVIDEQKAAKKAAEETKAEVLSAKQTVNETAKKVDEAVEASPKIEIDNTGKAKVVVPIKKSDDPKPPSSRPMPKPQGSQPLRVEFEER